jgi:hypothetical protein
MAPRRHPDEGKQSRDFVSAGYANEISQQEAADEVKRAKSDALEESVHQQQFGRRTFPPPMGASNFQYATPTYRRNDERQAATSRKTRSFGQPFFTDPGSGEVDFNQVPLPYVFAAPASAKDEHAMNDKATWPAVMDPEMFTGRRNDPFYGGGSTDFDLAKRENIRQTSHELWKAKNQPVRTILKEIWRSLGKPGRHSPNYRK